GQRGAAHGHGGAWPRPFPDRGDEQGGDTRRCRRAGEDDAPRRAEVHPRRERHDDEDGDGSPRQRGDDGVVVTRPGTSDPRRTMCAMSEPTPPTGPDDPFGPNGGTSLLERT